MAKNKDAFWFKHDSNAKYDNKILEMRTDYGYEGYGLYWAIIESMRESSDFKLDFHPQKSLSLALSYDSEKLFKFIKDCVNKYKLFSVKDDKFFSNRLLNQMKQRVQLQSKMSANAKQMHLKNFAFATIRRREEIRREEKREYAEFPDGFVAKYNEWIKYRFEIKKPLTETMIESQIVMLERQADPVGIIEKSIMNGWQGLFKEKSNSIPKEKIIPEGMREVKEPKKY